MKPQKSPGCGRMRKSSAKACKGSWKRSAWSSRKRSAQSRTFSRSWHGSSGRAWTKSEAVGVSSWRGRTSNQRSNNSRTSSGGLKPLSLSKEAMRRFWPEEAAEMWEPKKSSPWSPSSRRRTPPLEQSRGRRSLALVLLAEGGAWAPYGVVLRGLLGPRPMAAMAEAAWMAWPRVGLSPQKATPTGPRHLQTRPWFRTALRPASKEA
mmetsp:Transcript_70100/g.194917  ORF Transcript_70100/g.194917 Transcript_70100/m.194917 type:complete len:207 (+) Transcript_70100:1389-2009(+)